MISEEIKMQLLKTNQNKSERVLRFIISLLLLPTPYILGSSTYSTILFIFGAILLFNALVGTCFTYRLFGVDTCSIEK